MIQTVCAIQTYVDDGHAKQRQIHFGKRLYSATLLGQRLALPGSPPATEISKKMHGLSEPEFSWIRRTHHILDKPTCCHLWCSQIPCLSPWPGPYDCCHETLAKSWNWKVAIATQPQWQPGRAPQMWSIATWCKALILIWVWKWEITIRKPSCLMGIFGFKPLKAAYFWVALFQIKPSGFGFDFKLWKVSIRRCTRKRLLWGPTLHVFWSVDILWTVPKFSNLNCADYDVSCPDERKAWGGCSFVVRWLLATDLRIQSGSAANFLTNMFNRIQ